MIVHLFLDDSTPKNGGLVFYAGSHKEKLLNFKMRKSHKEKISKKGISRPGWTIVQDEVRRIKNFKEIKIDGKSGSICFMHGHLVHSSMPNKSLVKDRATYSMAYLNKNAKFKGKALQAKKLELV